MVGIHELLEAGIWKGTSAGMNTIDQSLERLCQAKQINCENALANAGNPTELWHLLRRS